MHKMCFLRRRMRQEDETVWSKIQKSMFLNKNIAFPTLTLSGIKIKRLYVLAHFCRVPCR